MNDIQRLQFENLLWIVFIGLIIGNIIGDEKEIAFLKTNDKQKEEEANQIFENVLLVTIFIYLYFLQRNVNAYKESNEKDLYEIKVIGSSLLVIGIVCLYYFQKKQENFVGSPGI